MTTELPVNKIVQGECRELLHSWPQGSVQQVVTSPPYWGLRDYGEGTAAIWGGSPDCEHEWAPYKTNEEGYSSRRKWQQGANRKEEPELWTKDVRTGAWCQNCDAWRGQLGLEPHPKEYIKHLVEVSQAIRHILNDRGTFWLNVGDTFYASGGKGNQYQANKKGEPNPYRQNSKARSNWLQPKQLLGIPERVMIALQDDGWILRNKIIWWKKKAMPESVKDRFSTTWEAVFLFVKARFYEFNLDVVRVPHSPYTLKDLAHRKVKRYRETGYRPYKAQTSGRPRESFFNPQGKNPGDVWHISLKPSPIPHFAAYPEELVTRIIKAGSSKGEIVLDPFNGSGTTTYVARKLGRKFIGIDIKEEFNEMARQRLTTGRYRDPAGIKPLK